MRRSRPDWAQGRGRPASCWVRRSTACTGTGGELGCALTLRRPLVAIGAPVAAYLPETAARLHTELVIPPHADVANAVGAVAGGIIQRQRALISPLDDESGVRLHLPDGVHDFAILEEAVQYAEEIMRPRVESLAAEAGAEQVVTQTTRRDQIAPVRGRRGLPGDGADLRRHRAAVGGAAWGVGRGFWITKSLRTRNEISVASSLHSPSGASFDYARRRVWVMQSRGSRAPCSAQDANFKVTS